MDNLRVAVIAGVVVCHVAASYAVDVPWYYEERSAGFVTQAALTLLLGPAVLFGMAVLFLLAGMLTPRSLARKGPRHFLRDRLVRLGIPLAATVVVIVPLTDLAGRFAEGELGPGGVGRVLADQARQLDTGVMWFAATLLVFSAAYALVRRVRPAGGPAAPPLAWRHLLIAGAAIAVGSFLLRLIWPAFAIGPLHLNLWQWPSMAALFVLGCLAGERGWLDPVPERFERGCARIGALALAATIAVLVAFGLTGDEGLLGGWRPEALVLPLVEAPLVIATSIWLVAWFTRRWQGQGRLAAAMSRGSYAAYVLHPPVIVVLAGALRPLSAPAEAKFALVSAAGVAASFGLGWLLTRVPALRHVV